VQTAPPISPTPTPPSTPIETVTSPTPFESPTPTPPIDSHDETNTGLIDWLNPRKSWWLYLLVLAFAFVSYRSVKAALTPRPSFSSHLDAGGADVDEGTQPLAIESQVILTPHIADAEYKVKPDDASLIGSVRRDDV
jgi:hypothetical protein